MFVKCLLKLPSNFVSRFPFANNRVQKPKLQFERSTLWKNGSVRPCMETRIAEHDWDNNCIRSQSQMSASFLERRSITNIFSTNTFNTCKKKVGC